MCLKFLLTTCRQPPVLVTPEAVLDADSCDCNGCSIGRENPSPLQPKESAILSKFQRGNRNFLAAWFRWLTLCINRSKVICSYCRNAMAHKLVTFSKRGDYAFLSTSFDNYKTAIEKFNQHASSSVHQEAAIKCSAISQPSIQSSQLSAQQELHRSGLVKQLTAMQFLLRQGLALRGHHDKDGNLYQLLVTWSKDSEIVADWSKQGRLTSWEWAWTGCNLRITSYN